MILENVFLGLIVYNFKKIKEQVTGESKLANDMKMWLSIKNLIIRLKPKIKDVPLGNWLSKILFTFKRSKGYKVMNFVLFVMFMFTMSLFETGISD